MKASAFILAAGISVLSASFVLAADSQDSIFIESYRISQTLDKIRNAEHKATQEGKAETSRLNHILRCLKMNFKTPKERKASIEETQKNINRLEEQLTNEKLKLQMLSIQNPEQRQAEIQKTSGKISQLLNLSTAEARPFQLQAAQFKNSIKNFEAKKIKFDYAIRKLVQQPKWSERAKIRTDLEKTFTTITWFKNNAPIARVDLSPARPPQNSRPVVSKLQGKYPVLNTGKYSMNVQVGDFNLYISRARRKNLDLAKVAPELIKLDKLAQIKLK